MSSNASRTSGPSSPPDRLSEASEHEQEVASATIQALRLLNRYGGHGNINLVVKCGYVVALDTTHKRRFGR